MPDSPDINQEQQIDEDEAKDIQQDIAESDEDVSTLMRLSAGAQLVGLFVFIAIGILFAVLAGIIAPSIVITATINVGWVIEYIIIALAAAFVLYIFALVIIVLPGSVLNLLGGLAYGAAVAAGLVDSDNENN